MEVLTMYERLMLPITRQFMPWLVKDILRDHRYGELIEIERYAWGTPDGESDTECWAMTFHQGAGDVITFVNLTYTGDDVLALPIVERTTYWARWLDKGEQATINRRVGEHIEFQTVDIDRELLAKLMAKRPIKLEVA
jgi:hypothetical protein